MKYEHVAAEVVRTRFDQEVAGAWLCGSHASGRATSTSDVDIVVVAHDVQPSRETFQHDGVLIEMFTHTESSLREWYEKDASEYRCTLAHMLATGKPVVTSSNTAALQTGAKNHVASGPPTRDQEVLDAKRYHLSAAIDDLRGCEFPDEVTFLATTVVEMTAQLELAHRQSWTGSGKWLYRWLADAAPETAVELAESARIVSDDRRPLEQVALDVLERAGGWLQQGYRLSAPPR